MAEIEQIPYTLVFLETPHRLVEALIDLETALGDRQIAVGREMTKVHEEIFRGSLSGAYAHYSAQPPRGEITLVLAGRPISKEPWPEQQVRAALKERRAQELSPTQIAGQLASESGWQRREIYRLLTDMEGISHDGPG